jgi:hypothetical protein
VGAQARDEGVALMDNRFNLMSRALIVIAAIFAVFGVADKAWGWLVAAAVFVALAVVAIKQDRR